MIKKRKPVQVPGLNITVTPISAKERRQLDKRIRKRHARLRRRYPEIHGKVVDWIDHNIEDGTLYIGVRFKDKTHFSLSFCPQIVTEGIEFSDMKTGDDVILRQYYGRRDR